MSITVDTPDGHSAEFPDGTSPETIKSVMAKHFGAPGVKPQAAASEKPGGWNPIQDYADRAYPAFERLSKDLTAPLDTPNPKYDPKKPSNEFLAQNPKMHHEGPLVRAGKTAADALDYLFSPLSGAVDSVVGRPVEQLTGGRVSKQQAGDIAGLAIPVAGEFAAERSAAAAAREAGLSRNLSDVATKGREAVKPATNALAAVRDTTRKVVDKATQATDPAGLYQKSVTNLKAAGVELTPGQQKGGWVRTLEEAHKSNPLTAQAVADAEDHSIATFNKAAWNKVLAPLGEKYDGPIGRPAVEQVKARLGAKYDALTPQLKIQADHALVDDFTEIKTRASELPPAQREQLEAIIKNRVLTRMSGASGGEVVGARGTMDGKTFKQVESELGHLARTYKFSGDAAQRELGGMIDDVTAALRDNMERRSAPGAREELKKLNTAYAMFTRVQSASARRAVVAGKDVPPGVFTPGDLLQSVKTMDKSVRKGAFAQGDALFQDFAEDAAKVLPNRLPDSGTALRLMAHGAGLHDHAIRATTNALARAAIRTAQRPHAASPNYLRAVQRRVAAPGPRPSPLLLTGPAAAAAGGDQQPQ